MMDYNILNRGAFNETKLSFDITSNPGNAGIHVHNLPEGGAFCLNKAEWKYSVGAGQIDPYGWPKSPLKISINKVLKDQTASPVEFNPPELLRDKIEITTVNPSTLRVTVHITIYGVLMSPVAGEPLLSDKEILGYSLLDNSQKGMLALSEAVIDRIDQHFKQLGMDGLRDQMLGGQVGPASQMLPEGLRHLALPNTQELPPETEAISALPLKDETELKSLLIGDLVTYKTLNSSEISLDEIQALADYLLEKGWMR
jgi:hypothetical protein